jgi:nicotinamide-nucleotide amidase
MTAEKIIAMLRAKSWYLATAESCTGGLVAAAITDIAGSSDVFDRGFVTYSNIAKTEMLGVPSDIIEKHGAVSAIVAGMMAKGALAHSKSQVAVAVTGIAGPGGGSVLKPVGLVHFACATRNDTLYFERRFGDLGRVEIRQQSVKQALALIAQACT